MKSGLKNQPMSKNSYPPAGQRVADLVDNLNQGFVMLDLDWRYTYVNQSATRVLKKSKEKIIGKNLFEILPNVKGTVFESNFSKALEQRAIQSFEAFYEPLNAWFECRYYPTSEGIGVLFADITEKKCHDEEHAIYCEIVQYVNNAIIRWKSDGTINFFNEYAQKLFGYGAQEIIGRNLNILVPEVESTGTDLSVLVQDIVNHPERYISNINENVCRNGRRLWMTWTNLAIYDEAGKVKEILAIGTDITQLKQSQEESNARQIRLGMALEAAGMVTWEWDIATHSVRYSNNISAIVRGEAVEPYCSIDTLMPEIHPDDRESLAQSLDKTIKTGNPWECEYRVHMLDGTYRWILGKGKHVVLEEGKPSRVLGLSIDITERKRSEQEREKLILDLQQNLQKVKQLSGLLPICSHCKKIRDDKGYWKQIETYIREHSEAEFSHSICQECARKFYPDLVIYKG